MANFYDTVLELLKEDNRFVAEDGSLLRNAVYEAAMKMDENLLHMLLNNTETKKRFFKDVDGITVFDKVEFGWLVNNKEFMPDSFTRFKNKIGLAVKGTEKLLGSQNDVELVFPYKDCVLEGGQTKEDQKRSEIFYNETLAQDETDRLLYSKVLVDSKRYTKDGISENIRELDDNDNLIIKGNNLLVLSSLLKRYEGKVKCIYIDPPYYFNSQKSEDTFSYNSNFKLSTWLTFMKNRLSIARRLLSKDGAIFVQISDDGVAELHLLLKEIFNTSSANNFINKITVRTKSPSGFASVNAGVFETAEYIISFAKDKKEWIRKSFHQQYVSSEYDKNYKWLITNKNDLYMNWKIVDIFEKVASDKGFSSKREAIKKLTDAVFTKLVGEYALKNAENVFRFTAIGNNAGADVIAVKNESNNNRDKIYKVSREQHYDVYVLNGEELAFYSKKIRNIDGVDTPSVLLTNIWTDTPYEGISREGNVTLKGGKKPEKLIRRIIEMSTNEGDIVLDYHLGSGTTCAVAHKLRRKYIGVEQLDYGNNDSLIRLQNVINGDTTGISNAINWQGGGSFVYCELAKLNQKEVEAIEAAQDSEVLITIWNRIKKTGFISCKVNPSDVDANIQDFKELSLNNQKRFLMEILDKNLLYVNYADMDDAEFGISEADKAFTRSFYGEE